MTSTEAEQRALRRRTGKRSTTSCPRSSSQASTSLLDLETSVKSLEDFEERLEEIQSQLREAEVPLQTKSDELEKERNNVIHLVEVTSAYIKELENSVAEGKEKIQELNQLVELTQADGNREPPDGGEKEQPSTAGPGVSSEASSPDEDEAVKAVRQKLSAKIMLLQSDISEPKASHQAEMDNLKAGHAAEMQRYRTGSSTSSTGGETAGNDVVDEMNERIEQLEKELEKERTDYAAEIEQLREQFQHEWHAAFNGDAGGMDLLNRVQELELEIEQTRKEHSLKLKDVYERQDQEKEELKNDMATILQASLSPAFSDQSYAQHESRPESEQFQEFEQKIIRLEQELVDMEEKYKEEMQMEKDAHQREMEDTIRDVLMVRAAQCH